MNTNPFQNPRDPAWQFITFIFAVVAAILAVLALPESVRLLGLSVVIIGSFLSILVLIKIRNAKRNIVSIQENILPANLEAVRAANPHPQTPDSPLNKKLIIDVANLLSPLVVALISCIGIGFIVYLFPKQTLISTSSWQSGFLGICVLLAIGAIIYYLIVAYIVDRKYRYYIYPKLNSIIDASPRIVLVALSIFAIAAAISYNMGSHVIDTVNKILDKKATEASFPQLNNYDALIIGIFYSAVGAFISGIAFLIGYCIIWAVEFFMINIKNRVR